MEKWFVNKMNVVEVKTSNIKKVKTTRNLLDLDDLQRGQFIGWAKILKIFSTKEEAQAFFEKQKEFCETSVKYKYHSWYITFDEIRLCSITEEQYKKLFGDYKSLNDIAEGDELGYVDDVWEWYIAPYTNYDEDDPDADFIEIKECK